MIEELYRKYGELVIQAEIIQAQIVSVKQQIVEALNREQGKREKEPVKPE